MDFPKLKIKTCKWCKEKYQPTKPLQMVCSPKCAYEYTQDARKKKAKKDWKVEKEEIKKDITNWKNNLQTEIQKIARYIDHGLLCLARNQKGQIHGGHVFSKKNNPNIRFDLNNIHRQSAQSNKWEQDDSLIREKLVEEYGQEYYDGLLEAKNHREQVKYVNIQYHAFYLKARKISNALKKENDNLLEPRSVKQRIKLREEINNQLGIY
jgi:hypothetical protein